MRKLKLINGDLVESVGLTKNKLKEDSFYSILRGTVKCEYKGNPDEITEGIYEITPSYIKYVSATKKILQNTFNNCSSGELYEYWVPRMKWQIGFDKNIYVEMINGTAPFPYMTNLWNNGKVCVGSVLNNIRLSKDTDYLVNAGRIVNLILSGAGNSDLSFTGVASGIDIKDTESVHKFFKRLSLIHSNVIHNSEEADIWWGAFIKAIKMKDSSYTGDFFDEIINESNFVEDFFNELTNDNISDKALSSIYSLK